MKRYKYLAFAKINLFLLVQEKKTDEKLHKIDSLFLKYKDLYDEIFISLSTNNTHVVNYLNIDNNIINNCLITKTLNILTHKEIISNFYNVEIKKNIPIFSGLGGASSDLAIVLNHISLIENINKEIFRINALDFSSDLTFFLHDYDLARVYNYGDKIEKIDVDFNLDISLILNENRCSTKDVFDMFDKLNIKTNTNFDEQLGFLVSKQYEKLINDLKPISFSLYPKLKKIYDNHSANSKIVLMTGSGSTLFIVNN
ncbi:MAG: hypothetical protein RSC65_00630 [Malacoplasma sp.]